MKALRSYKIENGVRSQLEDMARPKIEDSEVLIKVEYSSLNYKDALGVSGQSPIFKTFPITPGIDLAGVVVESKNPRFRPQDRVLVTGCGLGETHDGGYAEYAKEHGDNVIPLPLNLTTREAMIYGTAGFTAALCLERMEHNGQVPTKGPILITGATGGVGQFAISFFARAGYEVHALTGKKNLSPRLEQIGAKKVIAPQELNLGDTPLGKITYGGAVDNIGGATLAKIVAHTALWGNVASVGLADSPQLQTTVMPFILRGVSLLGVSSNNTPPELRQKIWQRLAGDLKPSELDTFAVNEISLAEISGTAQAMLARQTSHRTIVRI